MSNVSSVPWLLRSPQASAAMRVLLIEWARMQRGFLHLVLVDGIGLSLSQEETCNPKP